MKLILEAMLLGFLLGFAVTSIVYSFDRKDYEEQTSNKKICEEAGYEYYIHNNKSCRNIIQQVIEVPISELPKGILSTNPTE